MNKLITICLISILAFSCNKNNTPKPDESGLFVKFFGGAFDDNGFSLASADDGGYYLAGSTYHTNRPDTNVLVIKIDRNGNKAWEKSYPLGEYGEVARDVLVDQDGNIVVAGYKKNKHKLADFLILKINKNNPDLVEEYVFGDSLVDEKAFNLVQAPDGAFIVYGSSYEQGLDGITSDMYLLKTNLTDTVWNRKIGVITKDDENGTLKIRDDGYLLWCGSVQRPDGSNMRLVLADAFGNLMWDYAFDDNDGMNQYGYDMQILSDGGYLVAGSRNRSNASGSIKDIYMVRTSSAGNLIKEVVLPGSGSQEAYSLQALDNQTVITGYTTSDKGDRNIYVANLDANGNVLSSNTFGGAGDDVGNKVLKTVDGFIIIGTIKAGNNTMMGVYKINKDLELMP